MGLQEKKLRAEIENTKIPSAIKSLTFGHPYVTGIRFDIDFASFENDPADMKWFTDNFSSLWSPVDFALKKIASDQVGKDAVKAGLKVLKFVNTPDLPETKYTLADGVLLVEIPMKQKKLTTLPGVHAALMASL
jgi:hypothetical protein